MQVPSFKPRHAAPTVILKVAKANHHVKVVTEIVVIAFNTSVTGGIQDTWLDKGLRLPLDLRCGQPDACNVPKNCPIVWLETQSCMVLNETHFGLDPIELSAGLALLKLTVRTLSLREGSYTYRVHLPVPNSLTFPTTSLEGSLEVVAVPSPRLSDVWICSRVQHCDAAAALEASVKHLPQTYVYIVVKDIDGYTIDRPDMLLSIIHVAEMLNRSELLSAVYNVSTGRYFVALGNFDAPGQHRIFLATDAASEPSAGQVEKVRFSVECSDGYSINKGTDRCVADGFTNLLDVSVILIGFIAGVVLLSLLMLMIFLVRSRMDEMKRIMISFMKHEGLLAVKAAWESWDLGGDRTARPLSAFSPWLHSMLAGPVCCSL